MVAHLDAVTSLAVDPNGLYLMSGSKCQAIQNDLPLENSVIVMALKVRVGRQNGLRNWTKSPVSFGISLYEQQGALVAPEEL